MRTATSRSNPQSAKLSLRENSARRQIRARRAAHCGALAAAASAVLLWTACVPEAADTAVRAVVEDGTGDASEEAAADDESGASERGTDSSGPTDAGGRRGNGSAGGIADGSSNTIGVGESGGAAGGTGRPSDGEQSPSASDDEIISALTPGFADQFLEFGRSSGNADSDAFVTGTNALTLCASGRFLLREQVSFSGDVSFIPDPDDSIGTWAVVVLDDGAPAIELRIEETTARDQPAVLQFQLTQSDDGDLFMNGARVFTFRSAVDECGG